MQMFHMERSQAAEFLDIYRGLFPEFSQMSDHLADGGPLIACELRQEDVVNQLRKLCGIHDPAEAQRMNLNSIRAQFGVNKVQNGVHCTDLEEDAKIEVEYFFTLL